MQVQDYCKAMLAEVSAWKAKLEAMKKTADGLGSEQKEKVLPLIGQLEQEVATPSKRVVLDRLHRCTIDQEGQRVPLTYRLDPVGLVSGPDRWRVDHRPGPGYGLQRTAVQTTEDAVEPVRTDSQVVERSFILQPANDAKMVVLRSRGQVCIQRNARIA